MSDSYTCWQCGKPLADLILPMSRREECAACGADQHVCRMCVYFDAKGRGDCNEERAETISNREQANFCDYFKPTNEAFITGNPKKSQEAKDKLAELFGDAPTESSSVEKQELSKADIAKQQLKDLFGD